MRSGGAALLTSAEVQLCGGRGGLLWPGHCVHTASSSLQGLGKTLQLLAKAPSPGGWLSGGGGELKWSGQEAGKGVRKVRGWGLKL